MPVLLTYYSKFEIFDKTLFDKILNSHTEYKWHYCDYKQLQSRHKVDMLFLDGWDLFDKSLWNITSAWKNRITIPVITNKYLLHDLLLSPLNTAYVHFIPKTWLIGNVIPSGIDWSNGNIWIWRTDNRLGGGHNIHVITSAADLRTIHAKFVKQRRQNVYFGENALLSAYLKSPQLFPIVAGGVALHKFHLRIYYIITVNSLEVRFGVYRTGEIAIGQLPYKMEDWGNKKIHDTHLKYGNYRQFPVDYTGAFTQSASADVYKQIRDILAAISRLIAGQIKPYAEATNCFHLFGCDFMVDGDGRVVLIEINISPDVDTEVDGQKRKEFVQTLLMRGICEFVITAHMCVNACEVELLHTHAIKRAAGHHGVTRSVRN
jgi:hypothetical protein